MNHYRALLESLGELRGYLFTFIVATVLQRLRALN